MPKTTFLDAAYRILKEKGVPLNSEEIVKIALLKGLIATLGKTPGSTMGARIYMDIKKNRVSSFFTKIERGKFGLSEWKRMDQKQNIFRRGSFKYAAYEVLKTEKKILSIQQITEIAEKKNLITSEGKTLIATMGAQLYTDIKNLGTQSLFIQLGKNKFGLRKWDIAKLKDEIKRQGRENKASVYDKRRSIVGEPINFEGLIYGPLNENGVIFLFSKIHDRLGINIEGIRLKFPDAKGRRKTHKGWEEVSIEFEYKSSKFKIHRHNPKECDVIVCWEHDWKECPIEVIELKSKIDELKRIEKNRI